MDAYIPQYKWGRLIEESIGKQLKKYNLNYIKQGNNAYYYGNNKIEIRIVYFHKEIGINFSNGRANIHSSDIIDSSCCGVINSLNYDSFNSIDDYFKHILQIEFFNVKRCKPNVFYGKI